MLKKLFWLVLLVSLLSGCSSGEPTPAKGVDDTGTTLAGEIDTSENNMTTMTVSDIAQEIADELGGTDVMSMAGEMIGAVSGASLKLGDNKFEIYMFNKGDEKINEAESGTFTFPIEGFGDVTMSSVVNKNYVLMFLTVDDTVTEKFKTMTFER